MFVCPCLYVFPVVNDGECMFRIRCASVFFVGVGCIRMHTAGVLVFILKVDIFILQSVNTQVRALSQPCLHTVDARIKRPHPPHPPHSTTLHHTHPPLPFSLSPHTRKNTPESLSCVTPGTSSYHTLMHAYAPSHHLRTPQTHTTIPHHNHEPHSASHVPLGNPSSAQLMRMIRMRS